MMWLDNDAKHQSKSRTERLQTKENPSFFKWIRQVSTYRGVKGDAGLKAKMCERRGGVVYS